MLHTSDWHLGRSFHREDMLGAQAGFVDRLVEVVRAERVDVVLVSGDVYDRALPSVDTVALANDALARLAGTGTRVVIISGNHDSATRLGFGADLIDAAGVHLRTDVASAGRPVLAEDRHGPVAIYPLPYLEPSLAADPLQAETRSHAAVLGAAMGRVRADLAERTAGTRSVVLSHAFVAGGSGSDSERDISVGGVCAVPLSLFDGVDYLALGHLHNRQVLGAAARYSGSPLPYSFSEAGASKGMWLVELDRDGLAEVSEVDLPLPRPLSRISGRLEELLVDPALASAESHFVQATLTDPVRPVEPMERLRTRFPHTLVLLFAPERGEAGDRPSYRQRLAGLDDLDTAVAFVEHARGCPASRDEVELLREGLQELRARVVRA